MLSSILLLLGCLSLLAERAWTKKSLSFQRSNVASPPRILSARSDTISRGRRRKSTDYSRAWSKLFWSASSSDQDSSSTNSSWKTAGEISKLTTPWFTLYAERLQDDQGASLDYWRVERADSAIVLVLHQNQLLLPQPMYRPGVQRVTLDFCGGRIDNEDEAYKDAVLTIVERELHIAPEHVSRIRALNPGRPWPVNSSFSNQALYGFVCELKENALHDEIVVYPNTSDGRQQLLEELTCLQCRAVLLEYMHQELQQ